MTLLAPRDAARRLDLSTSRIAQLHREGRLPAIVDSSGNRLFTVEAIEELARDRAARRAAIAHNATAVST